MRAGVPADWGRRVLGGEIMPQGTRGRTAYLGLGLIICSGLVGCMDNDKKPLSSKPAAPGLPNTPLLNNGTSQGRPASGAPQQNWNVNGQPAQNGYPQTGGGYPQSNNIQQTNFPQNGMPMRNATGTINAPTIPGQQQQYPSSTQYNPGVVPNVGPQSNAMPTTSNATAYRGQVDPQQLAMTDLPTPPPARGGVVPEVAPAPLAPVAPPSPGPAYSPPTTPGSLPIK